jgi:hypothetical protein
LHREVQGEALTGETDGPAIEPRNQEFGTPMLLPQAHWMLLESSRCPASFDILPIALTAEDQYLSRIPRLGGLPLKTRLNCLSCRRTAPRT